MIAVALAYALILQGVFYAMGAGLAAAPASHEAAILCSAGANAARDIPSDPAEFPECCIVGCVAVAAALPPPETAPSPTRSLQFAATRTDPEPALILVLARSAYPLGARAPPVLS